MSRPGTLVTRRGCGAVGVEAVRGDRLVGAAAAGETVTGFRHQDALACAGEMAADDQAVVATAADDGRVGWHARGATCGVTTGQGLQGWPRLNRRAAAGRGTRGTSGREHCRRRAGRAGLFDFGRRYGGAPVGGALHGWRLEMLRRLAPRLGTCQLLTVDVSGGPP